jgi:FMN reductase
MKTALRMRLLIVGMGGTTRANSSSHKALHVALRAAEAAGAETTLFTGSQLQFPIYAPSEQTRTEDAKRFIDLLRRAHGLVIASPGYHGSVSGLIKNALDYIEDLRDSDPPYLDGRAVGCIACASRCDRLSMHCVDGQLRWAPQLIPHCQCLMKTEGDERTG